MRPLRVTLLGYKGILKIYQMELSLWFSSLSVFTEWKSYTVLYGNLQFFSFVKDVFCLLDFHRNRASVILRTANCHCVLSYERESYNPQFRGALGRDGIVASVG